MISAQLTGQNRLEPENHPQTVRKLLVFFMMILVLSARLKLLSAFLESARKLVEIDQGCLKYTSIPGATSSALHDSFRIRLAWYQPFHDPSFLRREIQNNPRIVEKKLFIVFSCRCPSNTGNECEAELVTLSSVEPKTPACSLGSSEPHQRYVLSSAGGSNMVYP